MVLKNKYLNYQQKHLKEICEHTFNIKDEDIIDIIKEIWYIENDIKKINRRFINFVWNKSKFGWISGPII